MQFLHQLPPRILPSAGAEKLNFPKGGADVRGCGKVAGMRTSKLYKIGSGCVLALAIAAGWPAAHPNAHIARADTPEANAQSAATAVAAAKEGREVLDKALNFLKSQQKADGGWQDPRQPPALTAIVLRCFSEDGKAKADFVQKGYQKLLSYQKADNGGIYEDMLGNYNTAIAVSSLAAADDPAYKAAIDKAVAYLKSLQWTDKIAGPDGKKIDLSDPKFGGSGYPAGNPDGSNTAMMLQALHDAGVPKDDPAYQNALKFISRMQNLSETNDQPWAVNDGGLVYSPVGSDKEHPGTSKAGEYVDSSGKRLLRSYGSMTYAGLKSMMYAGLSKDEPRVKAAWEWIRKNYSVDENPGMKLNDPKDAQWGLNYYFHTMALALHAYGEPVITDANGNKHDWRADLIHKIATTQRPDGSFVGEKKWMEDNPVLTTAYVVLALEEAMGDLRQHAVK